MRTFILSNSESNSQLYYDLEQEGVIKLFSLNDSEKNKYMNLSRFDKKDNGDHYELIDNESGDKYILQYDQMPENPFRSYSLYNDFEIVISKFREDISWLEPQYNHCHVYDKSGEVFNENNEIWRWEPLKNVGRESHTYLYHIIENYDRLQPVTVFTQGAIHDHELTLDDLMLVKDKAKIYGTSHCITNFGCIQYDNWDYIQHNGKWLNELKTGYLRRANKNFGEFYEDLFGKNHPESITMYYGAIFAIRKDVILSKPKEFYQKIIKYVDDHINPEEGHYFERIWHALFSTDI